MPGATNRFVTLTGNTIQAIEPAYRDEELQLLFDRYMKRDEQFSSFQRSVPGSYLEDESVIRKAQKSRQKAKFLKLWQGETKGYASPSEADLALCSMLAFWWWRYGADGSHSGTDSCGRGSVTITASLR